MNHNFSFVLPVVTLFCITSCSSPQQKPTKAHQPLPSITDTQTNTPPSLSTTTKVAPRVLVPTPYVPTPPPPKTAKTSETKKVIPASKPAKKKASPPSKAKPSKTVKKTSPLPIKSPPTKKKPTSTQPPTTDKTKISASTTTPSQISVSLEALPLKIGPWTLSESQSLSNQCNLVSHTNNMHDGQGNTPTYLEITLQHIIFHTKSNIDTSYTGTGVFVEQQQTIPIKQLYTPTSILFDTSYEAFVNTMKKHDSLEIKVGFWPSWPVTQAYATTLKTGQFKTAYDALKKCNSML